MLTPNQQNTLRAAVDRIIPPDEYPGGADAGVCDYFARHLQADLRPLLPLYHDGLDGLEAEAQARYNTSFADLSAEQQDHLLRRVEWGNVEARWHTAPSRFFQMLVQHTAEGFYSDPGNGGNRNAVSWHMIGFDPVRS